MSKSTLARPGALANFFEFAQHRLIMKWSNYFEIYEELFSRFRNMPELRFLEIGVARGGSLEMWRNYFGQEATIVGLDIASECKRFEGGNTHVRIGDQANQAFLKSVADELGPFDIVLDDGGHQMSQQITSFEALYPTLNNQGLYLIEDVHTSYWEEFGGGANRSGTLIEYMKTKVDEVNGFHAIVSNKGFFTEFTRSCYSLSFYDSMIAIQKRTMTQPEFLQVGDVVD